MLWLSITLPVGFALRPRDRASRRRHGSCGTETGARGAGSTGRPSAMARNDRKPFPWTPRADERAQGIDHRAEPGRPPESRWGRRGHQWSDPIAFLVSQIRRIMLRLSGTRGHACSGLRCSHRKGKSRISLLAETRQTISKKGLEARDSLVRATIIRTQRRHIQDLGINGERAVIYDKASQDLIFTYTSSRTLDVLRSNRHDCLPMYKRKLAD